MVSHEFPRIVLLFATFLENSRTKFLFSETILKFIFSGIVTSPCLEYWFFLARKILDFFDVLPRYRQLFLTKHAKFFKTVERNPSKKMVFLPRKAWFFSYILLRWICKLPYRYAIAATTWYLYHEQLMKRTNFRPNFEEVCNIQEK